MQAIILAAGCGSRMRSPCGLPKVLLDLQGQTLLEYHLKTLCALDVTNVTLVVGHRGEIIENFIISKGLDQQYNLFVVHNDQWQRGNASSILAARPYVTDDRFLVVMGDHLFDPECLRGFPRVGGEFVGIFDSAPRFVNIAEATKARADRGHITALGKDLAEFTYVDMGLFICPQDIFPCIEQTLAQGEGSFNAVKRRWIAQNELHIFDCKGVFWIEIDTQEDLTRARKLIEGRLCRHRDGPVARLLNRRLSMPISRWLVKHTSITPNQISVGAFGVTVLAGILFGLGAGIFVIVAGLLVQAASILDGCDGEVARLRHMSSPYGAWLDAVLDRVGDSLLIGGITYGVWQAQGTPWVWLLGFLALTGSFMVSYTVARYEGAYREPSAFGDGLPATRDVRLFIIMLGGITCLLNVGLGLIGVLTLGEVTRRLLVTASRQRHSTA